MAKAKQKLGPNQRAWLRALRSGKYKQGRDSLTRIVDGKEKHCCLGVLCLVAGMKGRPSFDDSPSLAYGARGYTNTTDAPPKAMRFVALRDCNGERLDGEASLTMCNDRGKSFAWIADRIEKEPEQYFTKAR